MSPESSHSTQPKLKLVDQTEEHALIHRRWFLASDPETQTCRPIVERTDDEVRQRFRERSVLPTEHSYSVLRVTDDQLVGLVGYFDLNTRNRSAEIGGLIGPEFHGQGFSREAVGMLLGHLFTQMRLNKVYAQTAEFNNRSLKLLSRLGFKVDGRLRRHHEFRGVLYDDLLLSILAEEHV
jgi:RimJ/RimL family protein N-acetyltransferase